jgi:protein-disulfide isomerase
VAVGVLLIVAAIVILLNGNALKPSNGTSVAITPAVQSYSVPADGTHLGKSSAPVKVDVWEDFQCPACKSYTDNAEPQVIENYVKTGKVYYTYHFFPLIDSGNATGESHQAANAAMCALEQGRFWDYHNLLFANWGGENQGAFVDPRLVAFAENLGLDMTKFNQCFTANTYSNYINQDLLTGQRFGVKGTPSVFVNGTLVTPGYVPSYDQLSQAIDAALAGK